MKFYAGIGSRETKAEILPLMHNLSSLAAKRGWVLRSGGAFGADDAFEAGCDKENGQKEIFLPWKGYQDNDSLLYNIDPRCYQIAEQIHPRWKILSQGAKKMMARNVHQILGQNLKQPVKCVICYTPDGCETYEQYSLQTGGTGMAISLASINKIPVFNLKNNLRYEEAEHFLLTN